MKQKFMKQKLQKLSTGLKILIPLLFQHKKQKKNVRVMKTRKRLLGKIKKDLKKVKRQMPARFLTVNGKH